MAVGDRARRRSFGITTLDPSFARDLGRSVAKLLGNVTAAYNARTLAEMLITAEHEGFDVRRFYEVLSTASGGSWIADGFLDLVDDLLDKDVRLLRDHLGELPVVSLGADDGLIERLGEARRFLQPDG